MALDPRQLEKLAAQKDINRRHQLIANQPVIESINETDGKVRVWHFAERRWKSLWPVDAAEHIRLRLAALSVTPMRGPAGEIMVPTDAVEEHRARGYRLLDEPERAAEQPVAAQTDQPAAAQTEQSAPVDPKDTRKAAKPK